MTSKEELFSHVRSLRPVLHEASDFIWHHPETGGNERRSARFYREHLAAEGFEIVNDEKIEHAFYAEFGSGKPVIAILGEFDALPGLSQKVVAQRDPIVPGGPGHGCGHNLLGSAAYIAAIATKRLIERDGLQGTVRFYGCPEEELLDGKVKMIVRHMFDGCDAALSWHPMDANAVYESAYLASVSVHYRFRGRAAHAAVAPEKGRSALDAVELMDIGANYLREHVIDQARIHYTTDSGGFPPNVVPADAGSWYFIRAPHMADVLRILERVNKVAEGAALMSETEVTCTVDYGCWEMRPARAFADLAYQNLRAAPAPSYTQEELDFAAQLEGQLDLSVVTDEKALYGVGDSPLHMKVGARHFQRDVPLTASTDAGDVSFVMPMSTITTACFPVGVTPHTWQACASAGSSFAEKGAVYAAEVLAGQAYDLLRDPERLDELWEEFRRGDTGDYHSILNGFGA